MTYLCINIECNIIYYKDISKCLTSTVPTVAVYLHKESTEHRPIHSAGEAQRACGSESVVPPAGQLIRLSG